MARTQIVKGSDLKLSKVKTNATDNLTKEDAGTRVLKLGKELYDLQELMFAAGTHSLLIVLQGMDTSGKEGAIGCISKAVNVHGVKVAPFKQPTPEELAHDFLWRIHAQTPGKGVIGIFNRSHYEDVLVVRVHNIVPKPVWKKRYDDINNFEELLTDNNTIILKFFLHISKDEQEQRLLAREQDPTKAWKLNLGDWKERSLWNDYIEAYEDAINKTSTKNAPWHIVPADHKWYRNLAVTEAVIEALRPYKKDWMAKLETESKTAKAEIDAYRKAQAAPAPTAAVKKKSKRKAKKTVP